jgi:iron complex transport system substrate-binding protein
MRSTAIVLVVLLAGCRAPAPAPGTGGIITLVPSAAEILFAIGAGDQVVGVSDYCTHPAEAAALPRYGGFLNPSTERILTSGARAVVAQCDHQDLITTLRDAGLEVVTVCTGNLQDMDQAFEVLGRLSGREQAARTLRDRIHAQIEEAGRSAGDPGAEVVVVVDRAPDDLKRIFVAGRGSLLDDLLEACGARNTFGDTERSYPMVSLETIVSREPDIIIDLRPLERGKPGARKRAEELWAGSGVLAPSGPVEAVHVLETTDFTVYGPRTGKAALALARILGGGEP